MTPIAHVQVPAWGGMAPVVAVEGSTWHILDGMGRRRALPAVELNLQHWYPTRCAIMANRGDVWTFDGALDASVVGEPWRAWRAARMQQIAAAAARGWLVQADVWLDDEPTDD